jgi:hypothetical protein
MKRIRVPRHKCPWCDVDLDGVFGPDDTPPKPGDLTVCIYCQGVAQFGDDLTLEQPRDCTIEEVAQILRLLYEEGDGRVH